MNEIPNVEIRLGDCRDIIATIPDCSIDSIVTDPPYELGFMGKKWDNSGIAYDVNLWTECLRVLKPGGHLLAFGGTRTYHRMTCAIEDAGFEIRDSIHWLYGSGFPKSHDVSKAIDKVAGAEREVTRRVVAGIAPGHGNYVNYNGPKPVVDVRDNPATDAARQWEGWGTALKPAHEPIVVARKPRPGTVAANVLEHGTGALNIDGARVEHGGDIANSSGSGQGAGYEAHNHEGRIYGNGLGGIVAEPHAKGRWPANVITDGSIEAEWVRYFYCAKPSKAERNAVLDALPEGDRVFMGSSGRTFKDGEWVETHSEPIKRANFHPTVKPLALMRYLVRLVTPPGGTVLEPFAGSGTTLAAAILEGFNSIGCELTDDYLPIIQGRIAWAQQQIQPDPESLFNNE